MSFHGELIFKKRKQLNISQTELSKKLGFTSQFCGRIEKGTEPWAGFPADKVKKLCKILDLDAHDFCHLVSKDFHQRYVKKAGIA